MKVLLRMILGCKARLGCAKALLGSGCRRPIVVIPADAGIQGRTNAIKLVGASLFAVRAELVEA
jgi:hypothetical protein